MRVTGPPGRRLRWVAWRPRLRTILLAVNLLILLLPLGGIAILRLYESELIRSTEAQLLAQGAHVRDVYRGEYLLQALRPGSGDAPPGRALPPGWKPRAIGDLPEVLRPHLDVSRERILPPEPEAPPASAGPDPRAAAAGAAMTPALQASGRSTLTGIRVVDESGVVVATTRSEMGRTLRFREEVARALAGEEVSLLRERTSDEPVPPLASLSRGQRYRVIVTLPVIEGDRVLGAVVVSRTPLDIAKALYLNRGPLLVGAGALLAVVGLVSVLTAFTIARPVRALTEQAEIVVRGGRGDFHAAPEPGTREIARLGAALEGMARELEQRAEYIRTFASHVSHEFKTPLATIRGTVELMKEDSGRMTTAERSRFLSNLEEAAARLDRLVRRLLEMARADVTRPGEERSVLEDALSHAGERGRERGLEIEIEIDAGTCPRTVRVAPEIFGEILANLLDNARVHGGAGVRVRIDAARDSTSDPPCVLVRIGDDGPGVSEANAPRIFTPFFTTARERGGTGLGLSIAASLLRSHGGSIELERPGPGAVFRIRVPAG